MGILERADDVMDLLVVPSFTRLGPAVRRRVFRWTEPGLAGRTVAITGPTSGLGKAAAERLADGHANLVLLGRNADKLDRLADELDGRGAGSTDIVVVDLSDLTAVTEAGRRLGALDRLDALVNNGGALHHERQLTDDGIELTLATHVVAPFVLTALAIPALERGDDARVISVSSGGMYSQPISLSDLQSEHDYSGTTAYARAKRAQVDLTGEWARRLSARGITAHAMHPGWAATPGVTEALPTFERVIGPLLRTPTEGADTIVWLTAAPSSEIGTDGFWLDRRRRPEAYLPKTRTSSDRVHRLWNEINRLAGDPLASTADASEPVVT